MSLKLKFQHFLCFRVLSALFVRTFFNPDEYYQSMELAHRMAFGYGVITWEWTHGLRSYVYPLIISIPYRILGYLEWDSPYFLLLSSRLMHAVFTAFAEYRLYITAEKCFGRSSANWTAFLILSNWFIFNLGIRTLTNTLEMGFLMIVLSLYPFRIEKDKKYWPYLSVCTIAFFIRCTAAVAFIPLGLFHIGRDFANFKHTLKLALPISLVLLVAFVSLDSYYMHKFTFSPWVFVKINILEQASTVFGTQAFDFYLKSTVPTVLTTGLPLFLWSLITMILPFRKQNGRDVLLVTASVFIFSLLITSINPHKEDRFLLPIIPLALLIAGVQLAKMETFLSQKAHPTLKKFLVVWFITTTVLANGLDIYDKSLYSEYGRHEVVNAFTSSIDKDLAVLDMRPSVLFLGECFGYPLSCAMHREEVQSRYVGCRDQGYFMEKPATWFYRYLKQLGPGSDNITHLIVTENHFIWTMYRVLYATGFIGDITMIPNAVPDYKYRRRQDSLIIRRDFTAKKNWWYFNETADNWVFNLTMPPDLDEKEKSEAQLLYPMPKLDVEKTPENNTVPSSETIHHKDGPIEGPISEKTSEAGDDSSISENSEAQMLVPMVKLDVETPENDVFPSSETIDHKDGPIEGPILEKTSEAGDDSSPSENSEAQLLVPVVKLTVPSSETIHDRDGPIEGPISSKTSEAGDDSSPSENSEVVYQ